jgi:hypothetical protein
MTMDDWLPWLWFAQSGAGNRDLSGYLASGLVLATFTMKSMRPLRWMAILSNAAFIYYALVAHIAPVMILHCVLLPLNVFRLAQIQIDSARDLAASGRPAGRRIRWPGRSTRWRGVFAVSLAVLGFVALAATISTLKDGQKDIAARAMPWPPGSL